jgi:hypothetical protein
MDTDALIASLASEGRLRRLPLAQVWWLAAGAAVALAGGVFVLTLGPRPDFVQAAASLRFVLKFIVTLSLAVSSFALVRALSRPGARWRPLLPLLAVAPLLLLVAVGVELVLVPPGQWAAKMIGTNSAACLLYVPLIGAAPLGALLLALRQGAPTRPALAGAACGLLAGGIAATFYAAHCDNDSPLFVAVWYPIAVSILAAAGAIAARVTVRW